MIRRILALAALFAFVMAAPPAQAQTDAAKMERNKKNVVEFYNAVLNEKDFDKASKYVGATYIQHNPIGADGLEGIKGFINFLKAQISGQQERDQARLCRRQLRDRACACGARARHARQCDLRSVPARRQRQGGGTLGRGAADPGTGKGAEQERNVLIGGAAVETAKVSQIVSGAAYGQAAPFFSNCCSGEIRGAPLAIGCIEAGAIASVESKIPPD